MKFKLKKNSNGQYFFEFVAANNQVICWSESYHNKKDAEHALDLVKNNALEAKIEDLA